MLVVCNFLKNPFTNSKKIKLKKRKNKILLLRSNKKNNEQNNKFNGKN